jgi:hypothetical protein
MPKRRRKLSPATAPGAPWPLPIQYAEQDLKIEFAVPEVVFRRVGAIEDEPNSVTAHPNGSVTDRGNGSAAVRLAWPRLPRDARRSGASAIGHARRLDGRREALALHCLGLAQVVGAAR